MLRKIDLPKIFIFLASLLISGCANTATMKTIEQLPLAAVVSQIKQELAAAQNVPGALPSLELKSVNVTLAVASTTDANGNVEIGVPALNASVGGGASSKIEQLSTIQVEFSPPRSSMTLSASELKGFGLTQMILHTREQLKIGAAEPPALSPEKVVISVKFGVQRAANIKGGIKLVVFSLGGGGSQAESTANTIVLTFIRQIAP